MSLNTQGNIPGLFGEPNIVYVFPLVVCPYIKIEPLYPSKALETTSLHISL